jgi:hypothetical protein
MFNIPQYSQFDQRWKDKLLGESTLNLGGFGCYLTALTMKLKTHAVDLNPGEACERMNRYNGFDKSGLMTYDGVERAWPQLLFHERGYTTNDPSNNIRKTDIKVAIDKIFKLAMLGQPVILCVDNMYNDGIPDHAILLVPEKAGDWTIHDPDGGKKIKFQDKYGDPMQKLYGWVSIIGPPTEFPDDSKAGLGQAFYKLAQAKKGVNVSLNVKEAFDTFLS